MPTEPILPRCNCCRRFPVIGISWNVSPKQTLTEFGHANRKETQKRNA